MSEKVDTSLEYVERVIACSPFADETAGHPEMRSIMRALLTERDALLAANESLAKDAERYRYIRHNFDVSAARLGYNDLLHLRGQKELPSTSETMDLFIDAALAASASAKESK